ncbi:uncharacterized protein LOC127844473 isoform X6 [Dreissena polymorpha]|uniref:uncharacterized protein LOC127844267 isoform X4 n=1 Tax=Dreissena polymorpha TaxID=45954 RepID=UPI0022642B85|nr:uncharacterized protein LOC127844267 isoform X4 [Dreissena polymorpha]XP_052230684.1 uncharacterized protein LOC127844473 isoform X6 [Dreissena polymorpha]
MRLNNVGMQRQILSLADIASYPGKSLRLLLFVLEHLRWLTGYTGKLRVQSSGRRPSIGVAQPVRIRVLLPQASRGDG